MGDLHLAVPPQTFSKKALLAALADQLRFPEYFGENWDAFDECLCDLSWLPPGRVILGHADVPLLGDPANLKTYVAILGDAVQKMSESRDHKLVVLFPAASRNQIEWMVRVNTRKS